MLILRTNRRFQLTEVRTKRVRRTRHGRAQTVTHTGQLLAVFFDDIRHLRHPTLLGIALLHKLLVQVVTQINELQALVLRASILGSILLHKLVVQIRTDVREMMLLILHPCVARRARLSEFLVQGLADVGEVSVVFFGTLI